MDWERKVQAGAVRPTDEDTMDIVLRPSNTRNQFMTLAEQELPQSLIVGCNSKIVTECLNVWPHLSDGVS